MKLLPSIAGGALGYIFCSLSSPLHSVQMAITFVIANVLLSFILFISKFELSENSEFNYYNSMILSAGITGTGIIFLNYFSVFVLYPNLIWYAAWEVILPPY